MDKIVHKHSNLNQLKPKLVLIALLLGLFWSSAFSQVYPDRHTTSLRDEWLSCTPTANPNSARGVSHWIMYDFGQTYALQASRIWNVNNPDEIDAGISEMYIDYSIDGIKWYEFGRYNLQQASSSSIYEGEKGPNFNGLIARFILITGKSNYGASCYGLSEIRIDGAPATISHVSNTLDKVDIKASPNPFHTQIKITIDNLPIGEITYQLTDIAGKIIMKEIATSNQFEIDGTNLLAGIYQFTIFFRGETKSISLTKQ